MIRTEELSKRYGRTEALRGATFEAPDGAVFALVGPNGAGKTTAIKTLMNIFQPTSGRAEVLGVDSRRIGPEQLARIGYVSENQRLPEWMRVGDFLAYCKPFYPNWQDSDAAELVRAYELPIDRKLKALSRGMRMKAGLTSSLAYRPELIVLDEPFGGLDVLVREQLIETLLDRTPEATILIASHDLAEMEGFATHIAYLNDGRVEFVEEMAALGVRFREMEVTLDAPAEPLRNCPSAWLRLERSGVVVRFVDSRYAPARTEAEIRSRFTGVREISARPMPLRAIVVALAKSARNKS
jgi:ABC-2 type transport system ATP-binding protein